MNLLLLVVLLVLFAVVFRINYINGSKDHFPFLEDRNAGMALKLLCSLIVLCGHTYAGNVWLKPIHDLGYLMVAVFFSLSGYGIAKTKPKLAEKPGRWLIYRIKKLVVPFWFTNLLCIILYGALLEKITIKQGIGYFFGIPLINHPTWFLIMLLILYIGFALCYVRENKYSFLFMLGYILIVSALCALADLDKAWYGSNFAFALGIFVEAHEEKICKKILIFRDWMGILILFFLLTGIGSVMYKFLSMGEFVDTFILRNIVSIAFCIVLYCFLYRFKITCRIGNLERCFFEIFLIHGPVQTILTEKMGVSTSFSLTLLTLVITVCISMLWRSITGIKRR